MATRRGGELSLAIDHWRLLAKSLRPPPDKFHGLEDIETRFRRRELDLIANEESRRTFRDPRPDDLRDPPLARRARLRRGRDAGPAAALRRRPGAALHHPPQRARPRPLPADRDRALPEAAGRRRHRPRLRARQGLPQRGRLPQAQPRVHDARVVRGLRRLREDRARPRAAGRRGLPSGCSGRPWSSAARPRSTSRRPGGGSPCARRSSSAAGVDIAEHPDPRGAGAGDRRRGRPEGGLGEAGRRAALPRRRAGPDPADLPPRLSRPSSRPSPRRHRSEPGLVERWEAFCGGVEIANSFTELNDPDEQRRRFEQQAAELQRGRRRGPALRRGLRRSARTGDAADRRRRPRDRPPGDDADRGR